MASKSTSATQPTQLDFILTSAGEFEVHKHNCRDIKRAQKSGRSAYEEIAILDLDPTDTPTTVIAFLWDDQIAESPSLPEGITKKDIAEGTWVPDRDWLSESGYTAHFFPCIKNWVDTEEVLCTGSGTDWAVPTADNGTPLAPTTSVAEQVYCTACLATAAQFLGSGEIEKLPRKRSGKFAPRVPDHSIEVETLRDDADILAPAPRKSSGTSTPKNGKADAKRLLATQVALAVQSLVADIADTNLAGTDPEHADHRAILAAFSNEEIGVMAATWIHHIPADRERWLASGLPRPDRSDWRSAETSADDTAAE